MTYKLSEIRKTVVAVTGFVLTGLSLALAQGDVIPEDATKWVVLAITLGTSYGVFKVENEPSGTLGR